MSEKDYYDYYVNGEKVTLDGNDAGVYTSARSKARNMWSLARSRGICTCTQSQGNLGDGTPTSAISTMRDGTLVSFIAVEKVTMPDEPKYMARVRGSGSNLITRDRQHAMTTMMDMVNRKNPSCIIEKKVYGEDPEAPIRIEYHMNLYGGEHEVYEFIQLGAGETVGTKQPPVRSWDPTRTCIPHTPTPYTAKSYPRPRPIFKIEDFDRDVPDKKDIRERIDTIKKKLEAASCSNENFADTLDKVAKDLISLVNASGKLMLSRKFDDKNFAACREKAMRAACEEMFVQFKKADGTPMTCAEDLETLMLADSETRKKVRERAREIFVAESSKRPARTAPSRTKLTWRCDEKNGFEVPCRKFVFGADAGDEEDEEPLPPLEECVATDSLSAL